MNDVCLSSLESKVNSEIKKVEKWLWNNKLTLNLSKTTFYDCIAHEQEIRLAYWFWSEILRLFLDQKPAN